MMESADELPEVVSKNQYIFKDASKDIKENSKDEKMSKAINNIFKGFASPTGKFKDILKVFKPKVSESPSTEEIDKIENVSDLNSPKKQGKVVAAIKKSADLTAHKVKFGVSEAWHEVKGIANHHTNDTGSLEKLSIEELAAEVGPLND